MNPSLRTRPTDAAVFIVSRMLTTEVPQQIYLDFARVEQKQFFSSGDASFASEGSMSIIETLLGFKRPTLFALNHYLCLGKISYILRSQVKFTANATIVPKPDTTSPSYNYIQDILPTHTYTPTQAHVLPLPFQD
eukprot:GHVP01053817.1.p1 GENE.GHVP01053817.1~~GHVP01053817.1.p1  ORF type:complete len:135 (+),score=5.30 GHVP01053817.1:686-1090(+)